MVHPRIKDRRPGFGQVIDMQQEAIELYDIFKFDKFFRLRYFIIGPEYYVIPEDHDTSPLDIQ
jgi:hypothetical protein